jgi:hypothetical protein
VPPDGVLEMIVFGSIIIREKRKNKGESLLRAAAGGASLPRGKRVDVD